MKVYALDTNILSFLLKEDERVNDNADVATRNGHELIIPPIVDYEVQRGLLAKQMTKKLNQYLEFRQSVSVGVFDEDVWQKAAYIYTSLIQQGKPIDDPDILDSCFLSGT